MIRTILADDHKLFCDGLERLLNDTTHFQVLEKFYNGFALLDRIRFHQPDLVVIDVEMPGLSGFDVIKRIRINDEETRIVVLSMHEENVFSQEAFELGANGYLNKAMESMALIDALTRICNGERFSAPPSATPRLESPFSDREAEILKMIASGKTSDQIAERLSISPLTVKAHRRNMMRKLKVNNAAEMVTKALEMGFLY